MAKYELKEIKNKNTWEKFVFSRNPKSFLQSWNWGETYRLVGNEIFRLGFYQKENLVGVCLVIKEKARRGIYFLIPGGPLLDWENRPLVNFFLITVKNLAKKEKVWFVRVRPELLDCKDSRTLFSRLGFISAPMHLHAENTWVLGIMPDEEQILLEMRKNTRYSIKKSLKENLSFEETIDPKHSTILKRLQDETVERHKFVGFTERLFWAQLKTFGKDGQAKLYICKKGNTPLVASIIIFYGDYAYYHHSGSSEKARKILASYFTQWKIIQEAKARGLKYYNMWGIAPPDKPRHRFAGVTLFKKGFGGERVDWLPAHDLVVSPFYWATYLIETARRITRRL